MIKSSQFWFLLVVSCGVTSFNLDVRTGTVYNHPSGTPASYFGYSVILHSHQNKRWLVAGAPLSDVTSSDGKNLTSYGAAFMCDTTGLKNCSLIDIDSSPEEEEPFLYNGSYSNLKMEVKSGQWLGATVSTGNNGRLLVCAPRYTHKRSGSKRYMYVDGPNLFQFPSGRCFLVRSDLSGVDSKDVLQPCKQRSNNWYNGFCQFGFSAADFMDKGGSDIAIGAVGTGDVKKQVVSLGGFQMYSPDSNTFTPSPLQHLNKYDYMGYDVSAGHFTSPNKTDIASGAPRSDNIKGMVVIYEDKSDKVIYRSRLQRPKHLQPGTYFGSTLCAVDLNNDGYTDLLVGAPLFSVTKDEGRVFVYINGKNGVLSWIEHMTLVGDSLPAARFGSAIASVGDLNRDGYQDVVIGAPYEGPNGAGAVYVYYGAISGIEAQYRQKIQASSVSPGLRGFGCSISGAVDVDQNGYPDIAVGSYSSGHAVLFKSSRIIDLEATIFLSRTEVVLEKNDNMCQQADGTNHKCLNVTFCFKFADREPSNSQDLRISYTIELDKDKESDLRRMYIYDQSGTHVIVRGETTIIGQRQQHCLPFHSVHIRERHQILDLMRSLTVDVAFSLADSSCVLNQDIPCPVLDAYRPKTLRNSELHFQKQCRGEVCHPDMELQGHVTLPGGKKAIHIGRNSVLGVALEINNNEADASYQTRVILNFPKDLFYIGPRSSSAEYIQCTSSYVNDTARAICDVGNPFRPNSKKYLTIDFEVSRITHNFVIGAEVTSENTDIRPENNVISLQVAVQYVADVGISGVSQPSEVIYHGDLLTKEQDVKFQRDIGPTIIQTFVVANQGPSPVDSVQVSVDVPHLYSQEDSNSFLFYLLKVEVTAGAGRCNAAANPLSIPTKNITQKEGLEPSRNLRTLASTKPIRMNCNSATCYTFICYLDVLERGDVVEITATSRLWQSTLVKAKAGVVELETSAHLTIPGKIKQDDTTNDHVSIVLRAIPSRAGAETKEDTPWWIYLLAILGGLLLLAAAIALMYKFGFFERHRHEDAEADSEEMKPMNV